MSLKMKAIVFGSIGVVVVIAVIAGYFIFSRAIIDSLIHDLDSPDIAARKAAKEELRKKSAKSKKVARVIVENLELSEDDIGRREMFIVLLTDIGDDNTIDVLTEYMASPESRIDARQGIIQVLSQLRDPRSAETLANLLEIETESEPALEGLIQLGKIAVPAVGKAMKHENSDVRLLAAKILGRIGEQSGIDALARGLKDPDAAVREGAVISLAAIGGERVPELLTKALGDEDPGVRRQAIDAVELVATPDMVDQLIPLLTDNDPKIRATAAKILGNLGDEKAVKPLVEALEEKNQEALRRMVEALGKLKDRSAVDPIIELLWGDDAVTRRACIAALGELGAPRAVKPILDTHEYDTEEAVVAYGQLKDEQATETLVKVLLSEPSLREQATESLLAINDPRTIGFIYAGLEECVFSFQIKQKIWKNMYGKFEIPEGEEYPPELPVPEYELGEEEEEEGTTTP
jgi:HEAT repeat protein